MPPPMLLAYSDEFRALVHPRWCARVATPSGLGCSGLVAVLTATRASRLQGMGQGNKFKPSDMTGGCLALT